MPDNSIIAENGRALHSLQQRKNHCRIPTGQKRVMLGEIKERTLLNSSLRDTLEVRTAVNGQTNEREGGLPCMTSIGIGSLPAFYFVLLPVVLVSSATYSLSFVQLLSLCTHRFDLLVSTRQYLKESKSSIDNANDEDGQSGRQPSRGESV